MKLLDKLGDWLWHNSYEKFFNSPCAACIKKEQERADYTEKNFGVIVAKIQKKRYGCPQDYDSAQDFIKHL